MNIKYTCEIMGRFLKIVSHDMHQSTHNKIIHYVPMDKIQALTIENNKTLHVKTSRYIFAVDFTNDGTCQKATTDILQYIEELPTHIQSELRAESRES
jgi:hypothetical protein